jgi:succinate-semialdehyde dehydrogenase/glutarate-semialdehyde dehydrogenase
VWGAFANAGQACASVERCYVHESIADEFIKRVLAETQLLKQNVGTVTDTDLGAMSSERQLAIVDDHVQEAVATGAKVLVGGRRHPGLAGSFYEPTVITNVNHDMRIMCEETFGPTLPIMTFKTDEEAVRLANDSVFGLTASVWTRDIARGERLAQQIDAGTVMVNEVVYTHALAQTPWGGVKQSGFGRTHGRLGLMELVSIQHLHVNRLSFLPDLWWFRYSPLGNRFFHGLAKHFTKGSLLSTARLVPEMVRRHFEKRS